MDEILVRAVTWIARGAGIALDLLSVADTVDGLRRDARKARKDLKPRR
ncbi:MULTISPECIES: hypothetical protein [Streptomyces]|uniref:Uncharacterized protein n=1 Tax=Streptomyces nymphaeiformis TaxID=2663842 RepID=A0A7W7U792_9ACTN|nr:hypothetical protein [Streptomyces nymphaeiformis]MBB4986128.1 hypothetical protein [Streptomyces nymphaeiformis]